MTIYLVLVAVPKGVPTWDELVHNNYAMSDTEKVLFQCIATLSSHQNFLNMTPWEIYEQQVKNTDGLEGEKGGSE